MRETDLPTPASVLIYANQELGIAYKALGDAGDWLRSDTRQPWTERQADQKAAMFEAIQKAKDAINEGRPS